MAVQQFKKKGFDTKKEASEWAKKEKAKAGMGQEIKWETNRTRPGDAFPWEAVLYKEV